jgi:hypothetical protein
MENRKLTFGKVLLDKKWTLRTPECIGSIALLAQCLTTKSSLQMCKQMIGLSTPAGILKMNICGRACQPATSKHLQQVMELDIWCQALSKMFLMKKSCWSLSWKTKLEQSVEMNTTFQQTGTANLAIYFLLLLLTMSMRGLEVARLQQKSSSMASRTMCLKDTHSRHSQFNSPILRLIEWYRIFTPIKSALRCSFRAETKSDTPSGLK